MAIHIQRRDFIITLGSAAASPLAVARAAASAGGWLESLKERGNEY